MRFLNNLDLGKKLGLLLLLPLTAMGYFVVYEIRNDLRTVEDANSIASLPPYFEALSGVIHELQKERGNSAGFLSSGGKKFGIELDAQRKLTDSAVARLETQHAELKANSLPSLVNGVEAVLARAAEIPATRKRVTALSYTTPATLQFYTGIINEILKQIGAVAKYTSSGEVASSVNGYQALLNMKEAAGIERAMLASTYASKQLPNGRYERILSLIATQDANAKNFLSSAQADQAAALTSALGADGYSRALAVRNTVLNIGRGKSGVDVLDQDPVAIFAGQSVKLEQLKEVESVLADDLINIAEQQSSRAWGHVTATAIEGGLALVVTILLATFLVRTILSNIGEAVSAAQRVGEGNLSQRIESRTDDEIGQVLTSLGTTQDRLVSVISDIQSASQDLDTGVNEIAAGNQDLSERTQQQASSLDEITKKMQALSDVVNNSTHQQIEGDQLAKQALELTTGCSDMVRQLYLSMQEIRESSKNIMTITSVIDEIAFQTNLLSLNAAVEAARAGEQGKGFAVVAAEVRQLAQRSSSAASEINDLIDTGVEKVNKGGDLAETARNALNDVQDSVRSVSEVMRELSSNSQAQADDIVEISEMVSDIDGVTQRNAALVEEVAAASETLGQHSSELSKVTRYFQLAS